MSSCSVFRIIISKLKGKLFTDRIKELLYNFFSIRITSSLLPPPEPVPFLLCNMLDVNGIGFLFFIWKGWALPSVPGYDSGFRL